VILLLVITVLAPIGKVLENSDVLFDNVAVAVINVPAG
jgi:hypothetical protein